MPLASLQAENTVSYRDGKLELSCADTFLHLTLHFTDRVGQLGGGEIELNMRRDLGHVIAYVQTDGENYKMLNPTKISIKRADWLPEGQAKILRRNR